MGWVDAFKIRFVKSNDYGENWSNGMWLASYIPSCCIDYGWLDSVSLAACGQQVHVVWWLAQYDSCGTNSFTKVFYRKSINSGNSFGGANSLVDGAYHPGIDCFGDNIHVACSKGYLKSEDEGNNWSNINTLVKCGPFNLISACGDKIHILGDNGYRYSEDNGDTWSDLNPDIHGYDCEGYKTNLACHENYVCMVWSEDDAIYYRKGAQVDRPDFDGDKDVDGSDLATFAAYYASSDLLADLSGNGIVGPEDLAIFAADFGRTDRPH